MDGLQIIDNNTGNKYIIKSTGKGQFHLNKIYFSKKNRRRQSDIVFSKFECENAIKNGNWSVIC